MRPSEWLRIVEWMAVRWTEVAAVEPPVLQAMYEDLSPYRHVDVQAALERIWRQGRERLPKAGQVLAMLKELDRVPERALPRSPWDDGPTMTLREWLDARGIEKIGDLLHGKEVTEPDDD